MNDIVKTYQERFRRNRHNFRRYAALLLALAMITTLFVNWQLHGVGISMTADYQCGEIEHTHTADCYEKVLVCPYTEGEPEGGTVAAEPTTEEPAADTGIAVYDAEPEYIFVPHEHTDACYTEVKTLTCSEEEHTHDDDCFDPEDGSLICDKFEHTHDDDCYTTERELTCGLEEGELVEELNPNYTPVAEFEAPVAQTPVVVEPAAETPVHHHTDACYEEVLVCPLPEHHHTVNCLSDQTADIEDEGEWLAATDTTLSDSWAENLIAVAKSQLGYEQSEKNFKLETDEYNDEVVRNYTRYGQWYGNPYGEWDVMFLSYCLHYAEIPQSAVPQKASVLALRSAMNDSGTSLLQDVDSRTVAVQDVDSASADTTIAPGDIVIYSKNKMETVVWEQSEPTTDPSDSGIALYSSGFVPSGPVVADDDFVASTDPTPVYTTKTTTVETVGIVESVDSQLGIVNVISGDVEGKVDTVQLSLAQVESIIGVTAAQGELQGKVAVQPATQVTYVDYFDETIDKKDGGITGVEITINGTVQPSGSINLTKGDKITLNYDFELSANTLSADSSGNRTLTYHLPKGITLAEPITGKTVYSGTTPVGKMDVDLSGEVHLTFNDSFHADKPFSGSFGLEAEVTTEGLNDSDVIQFPGSSTTIKVNDLKNIASQKDAEIDYTKDGKVVIHYTITVHSKNGWDKLVEIHDKIDSGNSHNVKIFGTYDWNSMKLVDSDGNPVKFIVSKDADNLGFTIKDLPQLTKGGKYILTYDVIIDNQSASGEGSFHNTAWTNDETPDGPWTWFSKRIEKSGSYNETDGYMYWTITVRNWRNGNLNGYSIKDVLGDTGATIDGNVTITEKGYDGNRWKDTLFDTITSANGKSNFDYTFSKDAKSSEYWIRYRTKVPTGVTTVSNTSTVTEKDNGTHTGSATVGVPSRNWGVWKNAANGSLTATTTDYLYQAYWKIGTDIPAGWDSYTITDTIKKPSSGDHYGYAVELQKMLTQQMSFTGIDNSTLNYNAATSNGIKVDIKYYSTETPQDEYTVDASDSTTKVRSFTITISKGNYPGVALKSFTVNKYYTYVDTSALSAEQWVNFENAANNANAQYNYNKTTPKSGLEKGVSQYENWDGTYTKELTLNYNQNSDNYIYYRVILNVEGWNSWDTFNCTPVDHLPAGLELVSASARFRYFNTSGGSWYNEWTDNYNLTDLSVFWTTQASAEDGGTDVTFHFADRIKNTPSPRQKDMRAICIFYKVKVNDSAWDNLKLTTKSYPNTISWDGTAEANVTFNRDLKELEKTGEQIANESGATYTIKINPLAKDLLPNSDNITLTDTLTVQKGFNAWLTGLALYDASDLITSLPSTQYSFHLDSTVNTNGENVYTMTLTIPDSRAYVLKYSYMTDAKKQEVTLSNEAKLSGGYSSEESKKLSSVNGWADVRQGLLTVHKVDSLNQNIGLAGATFKLYKFDKTTGSWETDGHQTTETTSNGTLEIYVGTNSFVTIDTATLYKLCEESAPTGYHKSDKEYYFIWTNDSTQTSDAAYAEAIGNYSGIAIPAKSEVKIYQHGTPQDLYVPNDRSWLTIQKFWQTEEGSTLPENETPDSVEVTLYKYAKGAGKSTAEKVTLNGENTQNGNILLRKVNGWKYVYESPENGYLYYVEEIKTGNQYEVSYGSPDGVEGGGLLTLTNKQTENAGYELPSTGGAGTTPFTAVGGTMMLAALAYGVRRKRRRKGGAAD